MQAVAAEVAGYAGKFRCFLEGEFKKQVCFDSFILKQAIKQRPSLCLIAF